MWDNKKSVRIFDIEEVNERINNLDRLLEKGRRDRRIREMLSGEEEKKGIEKLDVELKRVGEVAREYNTLDLGTEEEK